MEELREISNEELSLMEVIEDEICSYDLKKLANELDEKTILSLLNAKLDKPIYSVEISSKSLVQIQIDNNERLLMRNHWLSFEKSLNPDQLNYVLEEISNKLDVIEVSTDSSQIHILCGIGEPFVNSIREVRHQVNQYLGSYISRILDEIGVKGYQLKFEISKSNNGRK